MYKHNLCLRTTCDMFLTNGHNYNLRQKDIINLFLTQLRTENTQSNTYVQDSGVRYQAKTDRLPVLRSLRPGYEVLI